MSDPLAGMPLSYPDAETEVMALLDLLEVPTVTWLPLGFEPPLIQVQRIGGAPDASDITDFPLVRVGYWGADRDAAHTLASDGTRLITGHRNRQLPSGTTLDFAAVDFGSGNEPDLNPDDRQVVVNYTLGFRRQYHLLDI
jgi:hypothetical protein